MLHTISYDIAISILAFIGGYVDAAGYFQLQQLFTSSITGNLVVVLATIYNEDGATCRALVSFSFFIGAALTTGFSFRLKLIEQFSEKSTAISLYLFEILVFVGATVAGVILNDGIVEANSLNDWRTILVGCILAFSMGIHNAVGKDTIPNCPSLTVITMTLVSVAQNLCQTIIYFLSKSSIILASPRSVPLPPTYAATMQSKFSENHEKLRVSSNPLVSFLVGAVIGTVLMKNINFYSMLIPIFLLSIIVADICFDSFASAAALRDRLVIRASYATAQQSEKLSGDDSERFSSNVELVIISKSDSEV